MMEEIRDAIKADCFEQYKCEFSKSLDMKIIFVNINSLPKRIFPLHRIVIIISIERTVNELESSSLLQQFVH